MMKSETHLNAAALGSKPWRFLKQTRRSWQQGADAPSEAAPLRIYQFEVLVGMVIAGHPLWTFCSLFHRFQQAVRLQAGVPRDVERIQEK